MAEVVDAREVDGALVVVVAPGTDALRIDEGLGSARDREDWEDTDDDEASEVRDADAELWIVLSSLRHSSASPCDLVLRRTLDAARVIRLIGGADEEAHPHEAPPRVHRGQQRLEIDAREERPVAERLHIDHRPRRAIGVVGARPGDPHRELRDHDVVVARADTDHERREVEREPRTDTQSGSKPGRRLVVEGRRQLGDEFPVRVAVPLAYPRSSPIVHHRNVSAGWMNTPVPAGL